MIVSRAATKEYRDGWDRVFTRQEPCKHKNMMSHNDKVYCEYRYECPDCGYSRSVSYAEIEVGRGYIEA